MNHTRKLRPAFRPAYVQDYQRGGGQLGRRGVVSIAQDFSALAVGKIENDGTEWISYDGRAVQVTSGIEIFNTGLASPAPSTAARYNTTLNGVSAWAFPVRDGNQLAAANPLKGWAAEMDFYWDALSGVNFWNARLAFESGSASQGSFAPFGSWVAVSQQNGFGYLWAEDVNGSIYFNNLFVNTGQGAGVVTTRRLHTLRVEMDPGDGTHQRTWRVKVDGILQTTQLATSTPAGNLWGVGNDNDKAPRILGFRFNGSR